MVVRSTAIQHYHWCHWGFPEFETCGTAKSRGLVVVHWATPCVERASCLFAISYIKTALLVCCRRDLYFRCIALVVHRISHVAPRAVSGIQHCRGLSGWHLFSLP